MKRIFLITIFLTLALAIAAQVNVTGIVIESGTDEPLTGASVVLRNAEGKIRKYTTTGQKGEFSIAAAEIKGYTLDVSMMGFAKQTVKLDSVGSPLRIEMQASATVLKEVAVKADRIREQGDTISFNVGSFAQEQDRSIGDVLKRMPGIDVSSSGKIRYQGEDINKFYIEGSDLLGGKYGLATNGINHDDVGAVEVMENHQPMQVLSGISFSDKAAINLKLKGKAKATWAFHGDAGGGYSWQPEGALWDGELFAMAVMPGFQNITTFKANNTGEDLSANSTDFFALRRETGLSRYVGLSLPGVPDLSRKRTLFNRSALVSTNSLWKVNNGEFKTQIDYSFNRVTSQATNITTYFLESGDRVVTETRDGRDRSHSLSGKFIYEVNQKTTFINNTLSTNIDWDDVRLGVTGSLPNEQSATLPDYYVANRFKMIKRFNKGGRSHLVTFVSNNEWESLPQTLRMSMNDTQLRQHIGDHAFYTNESAAYSFSVKGITISLEGGLKGYWRSMQSELSDRSDFSDLSNDVINTNYLTVYVNPKFEYWFDRVSLRLDAPVSFAHYTFDKALANRSEAYFSPALNMTWKPSNRFSMSVRGRTGRTPMSLNMIYPGVIMTDYRTYRQGVDDFYNTGSHNVSANLSYKHTRKGLFANAFVMQSWTSLPYTMAQRLIGDYIIYSYADAKSTDRMLTASGSVGKTLDFMRGSTNVNASFSKHDSHILSEARTVNSSSDVWSVGGKINGAPLSWLSFDYSINFASNSLALDGERSSRLGSLENELLINVMPHKKWEWRVAGEHYRNELAAGDYKNVFLLDTRVSYKLSKRLELSASLNNILNQRTYNYTTYSELSAFESQRQLRGRELLISISLRK